MFRLEVAGNVALCGRRPLTSAGRGTGPLATPSTPTSTRGASRPHTAFGCRGEEAAPRQLSFGIDTCADGRAETGPRSSRPPPKASPVHGRHPRTLLPEPLAPQRGTVTNLRARAAGSGHLSPPPARDDKVVQVAPPGPSEAPSAASGSSGGAWWGEGTWSVVIPTYNRLPILQKCLAALEGQRLWREDGIVRDFEVVVVDDGSTDGTVGFLQERAAQLPHVRLLRQRHAGATAARNRGVAAARGGVIVFIDSDLVVGSDFLRQHARRLRAAHRAHGDDRAFSYGRVVNTSNFDDPLSERFKLTDYSAAFFATGNVAISRRRLLRAGEGLPGGGPFDADFSEYGWEDLELGERLRKQGAVIVHCPQAVGYHWHPPFSCDQLPRLIDQERQRGRNGVRFLRKHPNLGVRLMVQLTPAHELLWRLLTLGGLWNERPAAPLLGAAVRAGRPGLAAGLLSPILNWHTVQAAKEEARKSGGL